MRNGVWNDLVEAIEFAIRVAALGLCFAAIAFMVFSCGAVMQP